MKEIDTQVAGENPEENQNPKDNDTHPQDEEQTLDTDGTKNLTAQSLSSRKSSTGEFGHFTNIINELFCNGKF